LVDPVKIARTIKAATSALAKPNIIVPDVEVSRRLRERLRAAESVGGREAVDRLVRAQDQGANLTYFHPDAIHNALDPSYGNLLTTIDPKTFQDYSFRIPPETLRDPQYRMANAFNQAGRTGMTGNLDDVLNHYAKIAKEGRWDEVPNLSFGLDRETARYGWHPNDVTQRALPRVTGHEGRHRSMTMAGPLGDDSSLVVIKPDSYDLSRAYAHLDPSEYRPALKDMLEAEGSGRVIPQHSGSYEPLANRGFQDEQDFPRLPETWAEGGGVPGFHSDYGTPTFDVPLGDGKGTAGFSYDPTSQIIDALLGYEHPIGKQGARLGASGNFNKYVGPGGDQAKPHWGAGLRLTVPFAEGGAVPHMNELGLVKKGIEAAKGALSRPIRTYTGSPYKFDKFDPSFIGKGEGSAAYGHGFYSAENPQVGQEYRRITGDNSEEPGRWTRYGAPVDRLGMNSMMEALIKQHVDLDDPGRTEMLARYLQNNLAGGSTPEEIAAKLSNTYGGSKTGQEFDPDQIKRTIAGIPPFYKPQKPGWLYHLDINSHPDNFLDWDAPLDKGGNRRIMDRVHPNVADSIGAHLDYEGLNSPWDAPDGYTGRDLHHFLMQPGPQGVMSDAFYDDSAKKTAANYLSDLDVHGVRFLDKFSRQQQRFPFAGPMEGDPGGTRNYVVFPQSSDLIDIVNREKAEGGRVQHFDDGGQPDAGGGALSQIAAINPLKYINFFKNVKGALSPEQVKAVERVTAETAKSGNEAIIHGRYGPDIVKPYTSKMTVGTPKSIEPPATLQQMFSDAEGQPYSVHTHPNQMIPLPGEPDHVWSTSPSPGDVHNLLLPRSMYHMLNKNLPEMIIANERGNLLRIGGLHNTVRPEQGTGYSQSRDVVRHIRDMFTNESTFGRTADEIRAKYDALDDWAKANGVAFDPLLTNLRIDPATKQPQFSKNLFAPAGHDLLASGNYNRLGQMGIPVDVSGTMASDPRVDLGDAMKSWANYLEGKTGNPLKDSDPTQLDFNFGKAEGGMIRNYAFGGPGLPADDSQDAGDTGYMSDDAPPEGALSQVGWKTNTAKRLIEEEKRLNRERVPKSPPVVLPPSPRLQTVREPLRTEFPGIYKDPADIIADLYKPNAQLKVPFIPEGENMQRLFGVSRGDLDAISQGRDYSHLEGAPHAFTSPPGGKGSAISEQVLTPRNMQRYLDLYGEVEKHPDILNTRAWYEMQPLWDHMAKLGVSPEDMMLFNSRLGLHSAGANPISEINRGTLAHKLISEGRLDDYLMFGGRGMTDTPLRSGEIRASRFNTPGFPADMLDMKSHAFHPLHAQMLENLEREGKLVTDTHKIPTYIQGTDPVLADPRRPIADSHIARGAGYSDVRTGGPASRYSELTNPEFADFVPWWQRLSDQAGEKPRDLQALMWNVMGPQTGVDYIGTPKLEMLSDEIMKTARRLGVSPETARDMVLTGKASAHAEGGAVQGLQEGGDPDYGTFPRTRKVADLGIDALADLPEKEEMWRRNQTWKDWDKSFPERLDDKFKSSREVFLRNLLPSDLIAKLRATDRWVGGGFGKDATFAQLASEELGKLNMAGDDISPYQRGAVGALSHTAPFLGPAKFRQGVGLGYGAGTAFDSLTDQKHDTLQSWLSHFMPDFKPYVAGAEKVGGGLAADLGEALTRGDGDPSGAAYYASGGSTGGGASVNDDIMSFLKGIVPGSTDAFGDMPDIARHAPPPLAFLQPQAAQATSGGTSSSPLDSIFSLANAGKSLLGGSKGKGSGTSVADQAKAAMNSSPYSGNIDAEIGDWSNMNIDSEIADWSNYAAGGEVPGKALIDVMQAGDGVDKGYALADPTGASTGDNGGRDLAPLQFMQPPRPQQSSGGGGGGGILSSLLGGGGGGMPGGDPMQMAMKLMPMMGGMAEGGSVDDEMLNYGTMFYDEGGPVPGFALGGISSLMNSVGGGGGVMGGNLQQGTTGLGGMLGGVFGGGAGGGGGMGDIMGGGGEGMGGLPIMGWLGDAANLTKHISGGPNQMETETGTYPMDPGSGIWDALSGDKPASLDQGELIGRDAGKAVGRGVSMLFGGMGSGAFAEGFGRAGEGVGAMVQGHFGEGLGDLARGTPLQLLFKSADGGRVPGGALRYCSGGRY
jgi:hypothetical protein